MQNISVQSWFVCPSLEDCHPKPGGCKKGNDSCFLKNGKMLSDHKVHQKILAATQFTETL